MAEVEILLLRHGIAEPRTSGGQDALRSLTSAGRDRTRRICQRACQLGLSASSLVSSPLVRARQTGEIAVEEGLAPTLSCSEALAPGADPWPLLQRWWAQESQDVPRRILLVGHEPDLGQLVCRLIAAPPNAVVLKKAGLAMVRWSHAPAASAALGSAQLQLLLTPKVLLGP